MKRFIASLLSVLVLMLLSTSVFAQYDNVQPIEMTVNLTHEDGQLQPIWAWWGYDEPNYTYMKDGKKLIREISELSPVPVLGHTVCWLPVMAKRHSNGVPPMPIPKMKMEIPFTTGPSSIRFLTPTSI